MDINIKSERKNLVEDNMMWIEYWHEFKGKKLN